MQPIKHWITVALAALVIAGCASDGDSAPVTSVAAVTTSVADTTTSTTTPPPSSTSTTIAPTTTLPATTTTIATEDLIKQAVQDYIAAYFACGQQPATCDPATFTATQGSSRRTVMDLAGDMAKEGLYFSADLRGSYLVAESVSLDSSAKASAIYCVYDALIVLGPNGPDGLPTTVNDAISSSRYTYSVFFEEGKWSVGAQQQLQRLGEGSLCPAA